MRIAIIFFWFCSKSAESTFLFQLVSTGIFLSGLITQTLNSSIWQRMWSHFVISIFHFILIVLLRGGRWTPKVGDVPMLTLEMKNDFLNRLFCACFFTNCQEKFMILGVNKNYRLCLSISTQDQVVKFFNGKETVRKNVLVFLLFRKKLWVVNLAILNLQKCNKRLVNFNLHCLVKDYWNFLTFFDENLENLRC